MKRHEPSWPAAANKYAGERRHIPSIEKKPRAITVARGFALLTEKSKILRYCASANEPRDEGDRKQNDRHEEYDLRSFDGNAGNAAEAKQGGDERDDEKCDGPA